MARNRLTLYNASAEIQETEPGYGQIVKVLVQRRKWLLGTLVGTLAVTTLVTFVMKPKYQSTMQIMVESNYRERRSPNDTRPSFADPNVEVDNATQLNLMRSNQLLQKAVDELKPRYDDIDVEKLKKKVTLEQIQETRGNERVSTSIFEATYIDHDPVKTREVLRALQKVYQEYNLEQQKQRLANGLAFINEQLPQAESRVNQAESELEKFRKSQDLIDPETQAKSMVDALSALTKEQQTNRSQLAEYQARYTALQQQLERAPRQATIASRLSQSTRYQAILNEIQKTEVGLVQQRLRFTDKSPVIDMLSKQRQEQQALLQQEAQRVLGPAAGSLSESGDGLVAVGQLGDNDLKFASSLAETQSAFLGAQARERTLAATEQKLRSELQQFPGLLAEYNRLQPNVKANRDTLDQLLKAKQELGLAIARGGFAWQMVEQPELGQQISPSWLKNLVAGAVAGLMLGGIAAFLRESGDDSVRTSEDLTKQTSIPLLGMVPEVPLAELSATSADASLQTSEAEKGITQVLQWAPFRESLDLIYKNLQLITDGEPLKSLVVTSALAGEGKSTLALGLAISAARLHQRVLLIDADLRRPGLHKQLHLHNDRGLSTLLTNDRVLAQSATQETSPYSDLSISVLTSGPTPPDSVKLLSSSRMRDLMTAFEQNYDLVILDTPPVLGIVDALIAGSFCDGTLLVGRMGKVTRSEVTQATGSLDRLNLVGVIANGANKMNDYYYKASNYS